MNPASDPRSSASSAGNLFPPSRLFASLRGSTLPEFRNFNAEDAENSPELQPLMTTDPDYPTIRVHSYYYPSGSSFLCKVSLWPETVSTVGAKTIPRRLRPRVATSRDQRATYPLSASLRDLRVNSLSLSVAAEPL